MSEAIVTSWREDKEFLKSLDELQLRVQYVKLTILNQSDLPIDEIQGLITGGNITVNGSSAIRRSGSLNMVATDSTKKITDVENLISINKRAKIEVGIKNPNIDERYEEDIFWFNLGQFVLTNASISHTLQGLNISVNLKDKMALLNGECGGTIYALVTHSPIYSEQVDGTLAEEKVLIKDLIFSLVNKWGKIPEDKIKLNHNEQGKEDIPDYIQNTVSWGGKDPVYLYNGEIFRGQVVDENKKVVSTEIGYHENMGYILTDYVYPSELTSNPGESVMQALDKIKQTMGNYEYFFDLDGNFIFRKIQNYLDEGSEFDNLEEAFGDAYLVTPKDGGKAVYSFVDSPLPISYSNQPKYSAIKNDYVAWGVKGDNKVAIRYHLVIDYTPPTPERNEWTALCYTDEFGVFRVVPKDKTIKDAAATDIVLSDWRAWLYYDYVANGNYNDYGEELKEEFPKIYDLKAGVYFAGSDTDRDARNYLDSMVYWLDILDPSQIQDTIDSETGKLIDKSAIRKALGDLTVSKIGRRTKTIKDDKINCLFNITPPYSLIFVPAEKSDTRIQRARAIKWCNEKNAGLEENKCNWSQVADEFYDYFNIGAYSNPAYDAIRSVLHETTAYNESISITTIPVYHLEPNTRITVKDDDAQIDGDYVINSINIPLAYNENMTINASKAIERI